MATSIYVGNLSYTTTANDLWEWFSPFGNVLRTRIIEDHETGQHRGFGFVEMSDGAQDAIDELNGQQVNGRRLAVSVSHNPGRTRHPTR